MKKIIRLTESDLARIVKRVIREQEEVTGGGGTNVSAGATFNTVFAKATTAQYADLAENYSADGLIKIFPNYFRSNALALAYARKPEKIANRVYANRMGNGDEASGDGYRYRGRGAIQLTGKSNYIAFSKHIKNEEIVENPSLVAEQYSFDSALFFFERNNLWRIADRGFDEKTITELSKRINGGYNGLADRIKLTTKYKAYI